MKAYAWSAQLPRQWSYVEILIEDKTKHLMEFYALSVVKPEEKNIMPIF